MALAAGSRDRETSGWRPALKRADFSHWAMRRTLTVRPDSISRRAGYGSGRDGGMTPAARPLTGSARAREAGDYKEIMLVLLFSLLVFGWLMLIRNVRVGLPG